MDTKDIIYDLIEEHVRNNGIRKLSEGIEIHNLEIVCEKICKALGICEKCGAKLKGDRNE